jgi:hypothetical protein
VRRRLAMLLAGTVLLSGLVTASPAAAAEVPLHSVTMFSDRGDFVGQGVSRLFDNRNSRVLVQGDRTTLMVSVNKGNYQDYYDFQIAAPPGRTLTRGLYAGAERMPDVSAGRPGIDIFGSGRGCSGTTGRFEIRDIAFNAAGVVSRLHLLYEQHCEDSVPALFGEIRLGRSAGAGLVAETSSVSWPDTYRASGSTTVPVTLRAFGASPVRVSSVRVTGAHAADFQVRSDTCTGVALRDGGLCQVFVRFVPRAAGPRTAVLAITDSAGRTNSVQLDGAGVTGRTSWSMVGDAGDFISQGRSYSYTPANGVITMSGGPDYLRAVVEGGNGTRLTAEFAPGSTAAGPG